MGEPGLCEGPPAKNGESYRFFWLHWLEDPLLVRVDIPKEGHAQMTLKAVGHPDGPEFPSFKVRERRMLDEMDIVRLRDMIDQADFWSLSPRVEDPSRFGVDGAQWITEGKKDGTCHVVDRWSPEKGPYHELGVSFLLYMARLKLLYQEVY